MKTRQAALLLLAGAAIGCGGGGGGKKSTPETQAASFGASFGDKVKETGKKVYVVGTLGQEDSSLGFNTDGSPVSTALLPPSSENSQNVFRVLACGYVDSEGGNIPMAGNKAIALIGTNENQPSATTAGIGNDVSEIIRSSISTNGNVVTTIPKFDNAHHNAQFTSFTNDRKEQILAAVKSVIAQTVTGQKPWKAADVKFTGFNVPIVFQAADRGIKADAAPAPSM